MMENATSNIHWTYEGGIQKEREKIVTINKLDCSMAVNVEQIHKDSGSRNVVLGYMIVKFPWPEQVST